MQKGNPLPLGSNQKRYLLVVGGPTASGKTAMAIRLAKYFQTEILSCDSRQFYQEISIGTAKPTVEELAAAPHHFIGHLSVQTAYTAGDFERDALALLERLFQKHTLVILSGGSGLFIKAVCDGLDVFPEVSVAVTSTLEQEYAEKGLSFLQEELAKSDPDYYQEVDIQNPRRLLRALSVIRSSGQTYSSFRRNTPAQRPFQPIYLQMDVAREELYQKINLRVDRMMTNGLLEEARQLYALRHLKALQTVGYQELFDHFSGLIKLEEAIDLIKRNSRRYAKRQLTWFRRDGFWTSFAPANFEKVLTHIEREVNI